MLLMVETIAGAYGIPLFLLTALCSVESDLKPGALNVNDGGRTSYGLCQVQYRTAKRFGATSPSDLFVPSTNVELAARILQYNYERYKEWPLAVAAYNRGSLKLDAQGNPSNQEYVWKVKKRWNQLRSLSQDPSAATAPYLMRRYYESNQRPPPLPTFRFAHPQRATVAAS
jgi:soluble lytic murein transglycosylase-like protein